MYPKPITDLSGWSIRSIACSGKGWMVACDETVIGCSPSPCFGELVSKNWLHWFCSEGAAEDRSYVRASHPLALGLHSRRSLKFN